MFKHILVATDGSARADKAIETALQLARTCGDETRVTALMVVPDYTTLDVAETVFKNGPTLAELRGSFAAEAQRRLDAVLRVHAGAEVVERRIAVGDAAYEQIVQTAERLHCDLVVMAARGRGVLGAMLLGSQTSHVLALAGVPVLVVK